jgi:predicted O-methyltransferase YrrM
MNKVLIRFAKVPVLGRIMLMIYRAKIAFRYFSSSIINVLQWLFKSNETTNFTYDLEDGNKKYLAYLISEVTQISNDDAQKYMQEILENNQLKGHIKSAISASSYSFMADEEVKYARRIGWYVFVRATKPKVVVETGVDKGLGSCVLTSALMKNKEEGYEGKYYGTDINPKAGYLLSGEYSNYGKILYGDSIQSIISLDEEVDLFINDSDHSADYEAEEYKAITSKLTDKAIILGDNSHANEKLLDYSILNNRKYVLFEEKPLNHWYPGAGIGISYRRSIASL